MYNRVIFWYLENIYTEFLLVGIWMNFSFMVKTDDIGLPLVYDSLFLKVLPLLMILAGPSLCNLCKSVFPSPLLLTFRHNSKFNLFDFNPHIVIYFVSNSTILRALIYTISWLCRKCRVARQIEWDSMCGNYAAGI